MQTNPRLAHWANVLRGLTIATMVVLPVFIIFGLFATLTGGAALPALQGEAPQMNRLFAALIGLLSPAILLWTLNEMRQLFTAFMHGDVLTDASAALIRRIGQGFLALAVAPILIGPAQSLLLSLANPPGQRSIALSIESDMVFFALSGGLIIVIGWAMREASAVAAENRAFV